MGHRKPLHLGIADVRAAQRVLLECLSALRLLQVQSLARRSRSARPFDVANSGARPAPVRSHSGLFAPRTPVSHSGRRGRRAPRCGAGFHSGCPGRPIAAVKLGPMRPSAAFFHRGWSGWRYGQFSMAFTPSVAQMCHCGWNASLHRAPDHALGVSFPVMSPDTARRGAGPGDPHANGAETAANAD